MIFNMIQKVIELGYELCSVKNKMLFASSVRKMKPYFKGYILPVDKPSLLYAWIITYTDHNSDK